ISDYREGDKPLYIAFKYTYTPGDPANFNKTRLWRVNNVKVEGVIGLETSTIMNTGDMDVESMRSIWTFVDNGKATPGRSIVENNKDIRLGNGNNNTTHQGTPMEAWAIAKVFDVEDGNDKPIFIKRIVDPQVTEYEYRYTEPGDYEVIFIATNITGVDENKEVIRTVQ